MVDRIILGAKVEGGSEIGAWISQKGVDVNIAAKNQMMLSSELKSIQAAQTGTITFTTANASTAEQTVAIPDQGFMPIVILNCDAGFMYNATQQIVCCSVAYRTRTLIGIRIGSWPQYYYPPTGVVVDYVVTNIPMLF